MRLFLTPFKLRLRTGLVKYSTMAEYDVSEGLKTILDKINAASLRRSQELQCVKPRLVAVSKLKPVDLIINAYENGQRHFGENYIQELVEKSNNPEILEKCKDICWHFIGHLQSNKVSKLVHIPRLYLFETVDSDKIATAVNNSWGKQNEGNPLRVMVQVNTSGEEEKSGVPPSEAENLVKFVLNNCPNLKLVGLMTIGQYIADPLQVINKDFQCLSSCRDEISKNLNIPKLEIELSMGMSHDFEEAIEMGSTNVRVGSSIFGAREKKPSPAQGDVKS